MEQPSFTKKSTSTVLKKERSFEKLATDGLPQVDMIAHTMVKKLPFHVSLDDVKMWGQDGLLEAVRKFNPSLGVKFETFAERRIRGNILDKIRKAYGNRNISRTNYKFNKDREKAEFRASQKLQRDPTEAEVAEELGLNLREYQKKRLKYPSDANVISLDYSSKNKDGGENDNNNEWLEWSNNDSDPIHIPNINKERMLANLQEVLETVYLTEQEKNVLRLHFYDDLTLGEIAQRLDLHLTRIFQIKDGIIKKLTEMFKRRGYSSGNGKKI
ncbi:MAG: sigma-70 family RNA polymerase sigma factor [Minisyncoccia bacterium]